MNKNLEEKIYSMSNSFLPLDVFFNDIRDIKDKNYNKESAYKDLEKIADFIIDLQSQLDQANERIMWFNAEIDTLKSEKENLMRTLEEASEELGCAIVPKFEIEQEVYYLPCNDGKEIVVSRDIVIRSYVVKTDNISMIIYALEKSGFYAEEPDLFATFEEAQAKLQELRGGE